MKKLFLSLAFILSYSISAQSNIYFQNYTPYIMEMSIFKTNQANVAGGCTPNWDGRNSITGLLPLKESPTGGATSTDAFYDSDLNLSNTFNPMYPQTPLIDRWILNADYANPYILPGSTIPASSLAAKDLGMKFGVKDPVTGTNVAGYFPLGYVNCGALPLLNTAAYTTLFNSSYFTFGGDEWVIFF
ncbi:MULTISPECIES: hypothetical protein [unclassified Chryseobacterium]|uniref:hypothetical protein n=1 Tax=unclassified Chryseobacterium TaxID=2593645 RepID=UPI00226A94AC|nr:MULTISPECIES: hypothetical protein [unclassified Chryseobacterium]